jgi:hypothetical protein
MSGSLPAMPGGPQSFTAMLRAASKPGNNQLRRRHCPKSRPWLPIALPKSGRPKIINVENLRLFADDSRVDRSYSTGS